MPSPFPGMDPYLENPAHWPDVHQSLITYIRDALQPHVRPNYLARIGERVYIVQQARSLYPDMTLIQRPLRETATQPSSVVAPKDSTSTPDTPVILTLEAAELREPFVEIVHTLDAQVVTVIETLSPTNKAHGEGYQQYRRKQHDLLNSETHPVEIDLLATGLHTVAFPEAALNGLPAHRYRVSVRRAPEQHHFEIYAIPLTSRLPRVRIPLRAPDPDVTLELQPILTQCYDNGGYADLLDYHPPPPTPLSPEEAAWLDGLLKGKSLRKYPIPTTKCQMSKQKGVAP
jgi:hypothetical protein